MFVEMFSNNGIPYLRLVESERYTNSKGIRTVRKSVSLILALLKGSMMVFLISFLA